MLGKPDLEPGTRRRRKAQRLALDLIEDQRVLDKQRIAQDQLATLHWRRQALRAEERLLGVDTADRRRLGALKHQPVILSLGSP